jgi:two-component system, cell cycle response regulator DivK
VADDAPILLVDSDEDSRLIYSAALGHHGFPVVAFDCGPDVPALARRYAPWLLVFELTAGTVCWEVVTRLTDDSETRATPVLALCSTGLPAHRERALRLGCTAFLVKPVTPTRLVAEVRLLAASSRPPG